MKQIRQSGLIHKGLIFCMGLLFAVPNLSYAFAYTIKSNVHLRKGPGLSFEAISRLEHNRTLSVISREKGWARVKTAEGQAGCVRQDMISDVWIKVHKKERRLYLLKGRDHILMEFPIALGSTNPTKDKASLGDGGTPEGRFFACEMVDNPTKPAYGARSIRISYPDIEDARRGLASHLIDRKQYLSIVKAIRQHGMPDQNTRLGGSIRIHGGGSQRDWTLGCIALADKDIIQLYPHIQKGSRIEIYPSARHERKIAAPFCLNKAILKGAENQLKDPALYTLDATRVIRLAYPLGDIKSEEAVCTDIVIRALRHAGIDLQALVHEDAILSSASYTPEITTPSHHIDHRRVRTLKRYFDRYATDLSKSPEKVRPGDIVIMDTGIRNGTLCDHIGIVDDDRDSNGRYKVINIWAMGARTASMGLIGRDYPTIAYYYRMTHPFDYGAP